MHKSMEIKNLSKLDEKKIDNLRKSVSIKALK